MAWRGQAGRALRVAHLSLASGNIFSNVVPAFCGLLLALLVESFLDLAETPRLILSLSVVAAVVGGSPAKGMISLGLELLAAYMRMGENFIRSFLL